MKTTVQNEVAENVILGRNNSAGHNLCLQKVVITNDATGIISSKGYRFVTRNTVGDIVEINPMLESLSVAQALISVAKALGWG